MMTNGADSAPVHETIRLEIEAAYGLPAVKSGQVHVGVATLFNHSQLVRLYVRLQGRRATLGRVRGHDETDHVPHRRSLEHAHPHTVVAIALGFCKRHKHLQRKALCSPVANPTEPKPLVKRVASSLRSALDGCSQRRR